MEKFIDGAPLDARAEYIQKTFNESEVQVLADNLVREMHKMTLTVDLSDEQFRGQFLRSGAEAEAAQHGSAGPGQDAPHGMRTAGAHGALQPLA